MGAKENFGLGRRVTHVLSKMSHVLFARKQQEENREHCGGHLAIQIVT